MHQTSLIYCHFHNNNGILSLANCYTALNVLYFASSFDGAPTEIPSPIEKPIALPSSSSLWGTLLALTLPSAHVSFTARSPPFLVILVAGGPLIVLSNTPQAVTNLVIHGVHLVRANDRSVAQREGRRARRR
ncbi:hypothetical protein BHE74_00046793 [Ensete ventricosum]|nr:hypothetical protein GW17_00041193 [Ensete ventricosum]RWW47235.1 hypothetical protein BHE74_00046793 [Ensete ventricosum]RZS01229.1 hypothetical protein BHM03_00031050 [Ensete ventricosum]